VQLASNITTYKHSSLPKPNNNTKEEEEAVDMTKRGNQFTSVSKPTTTTTTTTKTTQQQKRNDKASEPFHIRHAAFHNICGFARWFGDFALFGRFWWTPGLGIGM
jgi:hypothetical protein